MFEIKYSRQAIKFIKSLDKKLALRIFSKIEELEHEPIQHDSKRSDEKYNPCHITAPGAKTL